MEPRIIKTEEQYRRALTEVERLVVGDPHPDSSAGGQLELLAKLVEDYEKARYGFRKPSPIEAIFFRMEEQGLRQKDIAEILGGKNRASEILAGKRGLTLPMIRALHEKLGISSDLLIRESSTSRQTLGRKRGARKPHGRSRLATSSKGVRRRTIKRGGSARSE